MSHQHPEQDPRIDPRHGPFLKMMSEVNAAKPDANNREEVLAAANHPAAIAREEQMIKLYNAADNEALASRDGLRITRESIVSEPDGNTINLSIIRPDTNETLPCLYYIHGGGMATLSCFYGSYQTWGRLLAHQGVAVVMVDFRNALRPSSVPEVAPFPAGLNDCVSGYLWTCENAGALGIDAKQITITGESGGGNLGIATTMKLIRDGQNNLPKSLYALCPFIAGEWPQAQYPSSSEHDGIFIRVGNNRTALAYGIEALTAKDPLAWPHFAIEDDVKDFPSTVIRVNEFDPLRDEGIGFYRLLLRAGVKAQCIQTMGTCHASELFCSILPDISTAAARDIAGFARR